MIYFNQYIGYLLYDLDQVVQYPFWLAEYNAVPASIMTLRCGSTPAADRSAASAEK